MASKNTPGMSGNNLSKTERREAAREKARQIKAEEARRARRNKFITGGVVVLLIVLVGIAIWAIVRGGSGDDEAEGTGDWEAPAVEVAPVAGDDVDVSGFAMTSASVETPAEAPVVDIYFDYMCPHCIDLEKDNGEDLADLIDSGEATVVLHPVAIMKQEYSDQSMAAFRYIAENAPDRLFAFHKAMADYQIGLMNGTNTTMPDWGEIEKAAEEAGVPDDVVAGISDNSYGDWVEEATSDFLASYNGTPTVLLDGTETDAWFSEGFPALVAGGATESESESESE